MTDPIHRSVRVGCRPEVAFRVFTEEMAAWWPVDEFSIAAGSDDLKVTDIVMEPRAGGAFYEVQSDGRHASWGEVVLWDPPSRLVLAWKPNDTPHPPTEVEVTFAETAEGGTRVDLEHRGWECLGEDAAGARGEYASGWPVVFDELFAEAAAAASG